eukprot:scaffold231712_cov18-Tisochrysis_lutea.AAC.1
MHGPISNKVIAFLAVTCMVQGAVLEFRRYYDEDHVRVAMTMPGTVPEERIMVLGVIIDLHTRQAIKASSQPVRLTGAGKPLDALCMPLLRFRLCVFTDDCAS